ncbi:MAG: hypothetical protein KA004_11390 [Verrucomicrobiales bacterium]|nr:hypothetical protein [Verrucomicrobiales bacterium]
MRQSSLVQIVSRSAAALALAGSAAAGTLLTALPAGKATSGRSPSEMAASNEKSAFDQLWGLATLYQNDRSPILEELAVTGRYQGQFWAVDGPDGNDSDWENRRFRLGLQAAMFDKRLTLKSEIVSGFHPGGEFYEGFIELYAAWKASEAFTLTIGKQKPKFSHEWSQSSRFILTFERNSLINSFQPDYAPGVTASGRVGVFSYYAGVFSNVVAKEFGGFNGGWSWLAGIGIDVKDAIGTEKADLRLDCIHSEIDEQDTIFTRYDNGLALSLHLKQGAWTLTPELLAGFGDASNWALVLTPTYDFTKKLQAVVRYQLGLSDGDAFPTQRRYEREAGLGNGDVYNAIYAGLNYYIYGHKLKLMTGVEWSNLSGGGGDSWTCFAGVRASW